MKTIISAALIALAAGSAAVAGPAPIQGSITYENTAGQLELAPVGSTVLHSFPAGDGRDVHEVYKVSDDKSLTLVSRSYSNNR
ncbi:hypothetical protein [Peteryoungia ipomoeae]|uniref:Uncharacterized protein n=1 Tax=Peteryoungia ipomoeae TaxID=1210932 RepID=A0A4S8P7W9_9HYPH|nr:hypothetical protein [Peteryoungia ipomoeae]THV24902.1 hypothetical protein FAA97_01430 [Peteryoungia ipomoeae]